MNIYTALSTHASVDKYRHTERRPTALHCGASSAQGLAYTEGFGWERHDFLLSVCVSLEFWEQ